MNGKVARLVFGSPYVFLKVVNIVLVVVLSKL